VQTVPLSSSENAQTFAILSLKRSVQLASDKGRVSIDKTFYQKYANLKKTFLKGSHEYSELLTRTPLGKCIARIQKKYFSHANLTKVEIDRPEYLNDFGNITFDFKYK
jgi:hypothetical protein